MPTLHLTVFWCLDADPYVFRTPAIFTACRAIAQNYGLSLETLPQNVRDPGFILKYSGDVIGPSDWQRGLQAMFDGANQRVRGLADQAFQGAGRLPIVFSGLTSSTANKLYIGQTMPQRTAGHIKAIGCHGVSSIQRRPTIVPIHCSTR